MIKVDLGKKLPANIVSEINGVMRSVVRDGRVSDLSTFIDSLDPKTEELLTTPLGNQGFISEDFDINPQNWYEISKMSPLAIARAMAEMEKNQPGTK